jgi:hypothetical protein
VGEDGQPRRFYRHESVRRRRSPRRGLALFAVLAAAAGFLFFWLARQELEEPPAAFLEARSLLSRGGEDALAEAVRLLRPLSGQSFGGESVDGLRGRAEQELAIGRQSRTRLAQEEDAFIAETARLAESSPDDLRTLRDRIGIHESRWPGSARAAEMRYHLEAAEAGGPEHLAHWHRFEEELREARRAANFERAFTLIEGVETDSVLGVRFARRIESARDALAREYRPYFEKRLSEALDAKARGDRAGAARILAELAAMAAGPFAAEAQGHLKKLE